MAGWSRTSLTKFCAFFFFFFFFFFSLSLSLSLFLSLFSYLFKDLGVSPNFSSQDCSGDDRCWNEKEVDQLSQRQTKEHCQASREETPCVQENRQSLHRSLHFQRIEVVVFAAFQGTYTVTDIESGLILDMELAHVSETDGQSIIHYSCLE